MTAPSATRLAATALVALALAGCGGEEEKEEPQIPRADASALINRLEEAQRRSDPFRCNDLREDTLPALERQLAALPQDVDPDVRSTVEDGIAHLSRLVDEECERTREETKTETTPTTPSETPSTPAPTEPEPEETTPAPTTPAPVPEPEPEEPGEGGVPAPEGGGGGAAAPGKGKKPKGDG